jgi:threonine aldolase
MLTGAMVNDVVPSNGAYLILEDIESNVILSDDCHACPTKVISLENMLRGLVVPQGSAENFGIRQETCYQDALGWCQTVGSCCSGCMFVILV